MPGLIGVDGGRKQAGAQGALRLVLFLTCGKMGNQAKLLSWGTSVFSLLLNLEYLLHRELRKILIFFKYLIQGV